MHALYLIFTLAAVNIDEKQAGEGLGITGIILCMFGLLYDGFWKRFGLPGSGRCCGRHILCNGLSACEEVCTGNFYEVCDDELYPEECLGQDTQRALRGASPSLAPLGHEPGSPALLPPTVNSLAWVVTYECSIFSITSFESYALYVGSFLPL